MTSPHLHALIAGERVAELRREALAMRSSPSVAPARPRLHRSVHSLTGGAATRWQR